jgi:hypothetical protein
MISPAQPIFHLIFSGHSPSPPTYVTSQGSEPENIQPIELFDDLALSVDTNSGDEPKDAVFAHNTKESLHVPPVQLSSRTVKGRRAWVVFHGWNVGIYEMWYVPHIKNPSSLVDQLSVREAMRMQVNGFSSGFWQGYGIYKEACAAWLHAIANNVIGPPPPGSSPVRILSPCAVIPPLSPPLVMHASPVIQSPAVVHVPSSDHGAQPIGAATPQIWSQGPQSSFAGHVPDAPPWVFQSVPSGVRLQPTFSCHVGGPGKIIGLSNEAAY